jgi:hypothetical protein
MFILKIYDTFDKIKCELWLKHYSKISNEIYILIGDNLLSSFLNEFPKYKNSIINEYKIGILLTENDFIFGYDIIKKEENDELHLKYDDIDIDKKELLESICIGRIYHVPVENKKIYTTFEIPDFITYSHYDHSNYINGLKINNGENISDKYVCITLENSKKVLDTKYYENDILYDNTNTICNYFYNEDFFVYNILVNKEKKYAIIWHPKCACSTIKTIFKKINFMNEEVHNTHQNMKYRYNIYLENIDTICVVRNPYDRILSCYFNKHVEKYDIGYKKITEYLKYIEFSNNNDTLYNFIKYIKSKNTFFDDHSTPYNNFVYNNYNLKYKIIHMEDNLNEQLYLFFSNYHKNEDISFIKNIISNITSNTVNIKNENYKNFSVDEWIKFKNINDGIPRYEYILDRELKDDIYEVYQNDFVKYGYNKEYHIHHINKEIHLEDFDVNMYRLLNDDLKNMIDAELKIHYSLFGKYENRSYKFDLPQDFNAFEYQLLNEDLKHMNELELKIHYVISGKNEKRIYKI